jgi:hypothetical protein
MKYLICVAGLFTALLLQPIYADDGCNYDTQCKGDRVCLNGSCVAPTDGEKDGDAEELSTTCKFTAGPRAGQTKHWPRNTPGLTPARVGDPCHDGQGSTGYAIEDE